MAKYTTTAIPTLLITWLSASSGLWAGEMPGHTEHGHSHNTKAHGAMSCDIDIQLTEEAERQAGGALYTGPIPKRHHRMAHREKGKMPTEMEGAHILHEAQYGGKDFFMAPNQLHHVEPLYSPDCGFRVIFRTPLRGRLVRHVSRPLSRSFLRTTTSQKLSVFSRHRTMAPCCKQRSAAILCQSHSRSSYTSSFQRPKSLSCLTFSSLAQAAKAQALTMYANAPWRTFRYRSKSKEGMPNGIGGVALTRSDAGALAESVARQRRAIGNSPRDTSQQDIEKIFEGAVTYW